MNLQVPPAKQPEAARAVFPALFAHWHPVARSRELGRKPIACRILDREIVLFRIENGRIGAMMNCCPHRGMRLSKGCVRAGRLVCPYHGWSFDPDGAVASPGNPNIRLTVPTLEAMDQYGLIWIKQRGSADALPEWESDGYELVHSNSWHVNANVEVVLDNFTEVEHTATAHLYFGYDLNSIADITNDTRSSSLAVETRTEGRQKKMPWLMRTFLGTQPGDLLCCEWVTEFTPLRSTFRFGWKDPDTRADRPRRVCAVGYFHPIGDDACRVSTIYFCKWGKSSILTRAVVPFIPYGRRYIDNEVRIDIDLVENVTTQSAGSARWHLGRHDKGIVEQRRRLLQPD
jgi:vanillate O-demethylase monooxygenase subunit